MLGSGMTSFERELGSTCSRDLEVVVRRIDEIN